MSHVWSGLEISMENRAGPAMNGPVARVLPPRNQFGSDDGHLAWGIDAKPDLPPFKADNSHADVVAYVELFHQLPRQYQHGTLPSSTSGIVS
jgi:hypothetical protein